ncbi:MAG: hypothetical protein Q4G66_05145 [bacterium]|nr:hypothetical protein [bacterium]
MQIYIWRHSKEFSSWSMLDEPHIHADGYMEAEVAVLAESLEEAYNVLAQDGSWQVEELQRLQPQVVALDRARILLGHVR